MLGRTACADDRDGARRVKRGEVAAHEQDGRRHRDRPQPLRKTGIVDDDDPDTETLDRGEDVQGLVRGLPDASRDLGTERTFAVYVADPDRGEDAPAARTTGEVEDLDAAADFVEQPPERDRPDRVDG